jgi:hypothetical protein
MPDRFVEELATLLGKGWWDGGSLKLQGDSMGEDSFGGLCYVFPAVRLALVAAVSTDARFCAEDPAARFLAERARISKLLNKHWRAFDNHILNSRETLEQALAELKTVGTSADRDERVRRYCGILLLKLDRPQEAESELENCRKMPSYGGNARVRVSVLYNLACAYARIAQKRHLCQSTLEEALQLHPQFRESLGTDPDFAEVRETTWFQELSKPLG